jgi:hypothetical protein
LTGAFQLERFRNDVGWMKKTDAFAGAAASGAGKPVGSHRAG